MFAENCSKFGQTDERLFLRDGMLYVELGDPQKRRKVAGPMCQAYLSNQRISIGLKIIMPTTLYSPFSNPLSSPLPLSHSHPQSPVLTPLNASD